MKKTERPSFEDRRKAFVSDWLERLIDERNSTVKELASKAKLSRDHVYKIKNGRTASISTWERIAEALDIELPQWIADFASKPYVRHGFSNGEMRPEYRAFVAMHQRVSNPNHPDYRRYGGAGITVDQQWANTAEGLRNFLEDMGRRPSKEYTLHRSPGHANYSPYTCVWADKKTQRLERKGEVFFEVNGVLMGRNALTKLGKEEGGLHVVEMKKDGTVKKSRTPKNPKNSSPTRGDS
jgi:transcriptional regulator with XRE-family HTH domain